ncbi:MAG: hypothetical protein JXR76_22685 [Deltaproteobacteria bacterium]|nr:hypothetical protein [Deltaproteobacteria bacterium]
MSSKSQKSAPKKKKPPKKTEQFSAAEQLKARIPSSPPAALIDESEKIPFSEVGTENNAVIPPPIVKPVAPVVKVRNRTPLPMPVMPQSSEMPVDPTDSGTDFSAESE